MNSTLAVAGRELRERSRLFLVAAAMAVIPFIAAAVPAARGQRGLAIATVAMYLAVIFPCGVALTLGISTIGRELSDKRLSFYFSKPLSAAALWIGKVLSSLLTAVATMAIIVAPAFLVSPSSWRMVLGNETASWALLACIVLFFVGHAVSTIVRSRSPLLALDLALTAVTLFAVVLIAKPLLLGGAMVAVGVILAGIAVAVLLVLAVAPVWQLAQGRIDARRNHAALSRVVWPAVGAILLVAAVITIWIVRAPLSSLREIGSVEQAPDGRHVVVTGVTSNRGGYQSTYFIDVANGETVRAAAAPWSGITMSRDGSTVASIELANVTPGRVETQVRVRRLDGTRPATVFPLRATIGRGTTLSDDGSRIAIASLDEVAVHDVATRKTVAAMALDGRKLVSMFFVTPALLRVITFDQEFVIRELDLVQRRATITGEAAAQRTLVSVSNDGSRMFLRKDSTIVDGRTGATIAQIPAGPRPANLNAAMLGDGSVALASDHALRLFDRDGNLLKQVALPVERASIAGQLGEGKLMLRTREASYVVDVQRGIVEQTLQGLRFPFVVWGADPRLPRFTPDATFTMIDANNKLVLWDAATGEKRPFPA